MELGGVQDRAGTCSLFHWGPIPWSFYATLAAWSSFSSFEDASFYIPQDYEAVYTGLIVGFGYPEIEYARGVQKDRGRKIHRYTFERKRG